MIKMSWRDVVIKNYNNDEYSQYRDAMSRVQKTGYCRRCQQMVTKYQKCPLSLPAPPVKPSCPMREDEDGHSAYIEV
tara:strand:- start:103 stop:333 length:231 start_codon:yes stop_codon:yes gene_type:complete